MSSDKSLLRGARYVFKHVDLFSLIKSLKLREVQNLYSSIALDDVDKSLGSLESAIKALVNNPNKYIRKSGFTKSFKVGDKRLVLLKRSRKDRDRILSLLKSYEKLLQQKLTQEKLIKKTQERSSISYIINERPFAFFLAVFGFLLILLAVYVSKRECNTFNPFSCPDSFSLVFFGLFIFAAGVYMIFIALKVRRKHIASLKQELKTIQSAIESTAKSIAKSGVFKAYQIKLKETK